jgi:hypothetical protein
MTIAVHMRPFTREDLVTVEPWFRDPDTARFLGGPEWPAVMLERERLIVGEEFRGAVQTGAFRYLAAAAAGVLSAMSIAGRSIAAPSTVVRVQTDRSSPRRSTSRPGRLRSRSTPSGAGAGWAGR